MRFFFFLSCSYNSGRSMFLEHFQGRWNESLTKLLKRKGGGEEGKIIILFDKHAIEARLTAPFR